MVNERRRQKLKGRGKGARSSRSSIGWPTPQSSGPYQGKRQSFSWSLRGSTAPERTATSASPGRCLRIGAGVAKELHTMRSKSFSTGAGSSRRGRAARTAAACLRSPGTRSTRAIDTKSHRLSRRRTAGENSSPSRYADQVSRYADQSGRQLIRIATNLFAMRISRAVIHSVHWSLCAQLYRYTKRSVLLRPWPPGGGFKVLAQHAGHRPPSPFFGFFTQVRGKRP